MLNRELTPEEQEMREAEDRRLADPALHPFALHCQPEFAEADLCWWCGKAQNEHSTTEEEA